MIRKQHKKLANTLAVLVAFLYSIIRNQRITINLKKKQLQYPEEVFPAYEEVYTTDIYFGNKNQGFHQTTIFDICSSSSWILTNETVIQQKSQMFYGEFQCLPPGCQKTQEYGEETMQAFGNQAEFTAIQDPLNKNVFITHQVAYTDLQIRDYQFKKVGMWLPLKLIKAETGSSPLLKEVHSSLGLGPDLVQFAQNSKDQPKEYLPFPSYAQKRIDQSIGNFQNKNGKQVKEFSIFYHEDSSRIVLGKYEQYFVKPGAEWTTFQNVRNIGPSESTSTNYALYSPRLTLGQEQVVDLKSKNPWTKEITSSQYAIFDSTTKYIWFGDDELLRKIISEINFSIKTACTLHNTTVYTCPYAPKQFPNITFEFTDSPLGYKTNNQKPQSTFDGPSFSSLRVTLTEQDYVEKFIDPKTSETRSFLLFRPGYYGDQKAQLRKVPNIWFGEPLLKKYYVRFLYSHDKIALAEKYDIPMTSKQINSTFATIILISSLILVFLCIAILISKLKKVPIRKKKRGTDKKSQKSTKNNLFLLENQSVQQQQQQNIFSMVPNNNNNGLSQNSNFSFKPHKRTRSRGLSTQFTQQNVMGMMGTNSTQQNTSQFGISLQNQNNQQQQQSYYNESHLLSNPPIHYQNQINNQQQFSDMNYDLNQSVSVADTIANQTFEAAQ